MPEHRHCTALIVGIDRYNHGISPLQSAVSDARAIASLLEVEHGYSNFVLLDGEANAAALWQLLEQDLPQKLFEDDAFFFYFAGHGVARGSGAEGPQGYLLPADAEATSEASWVSMTRLRAAIEALQCKHLLAVLDCCFAGSFRWSATRDCVFDDRPLYDSEYERYLNGTAWQALTSATQDQKALDVCPGQHNTRDSDQQSSHSPFAAALLRGLSGLADSSRGNHEPDGVITATELYQYVFEELVPAGGPSHQTPGLWPLRPENTGDFIFFNPQKPVQTRADPPLDDGNNPWLGLRSYAEHDAGMFFGRERVITEILDRVNDTEQRFHVVVGASGTGKSSAISAGVLPRLQKDANPTPWSVVVAPRLTSHPEQQLRVLTQQLPEAGGDARVLLVFDQFEELYTQCADGAQRAQFRAALIALLEQHPTLSILLSLRSDFEPRPARSAEFAERWAQSRYVVPALSVEEFRDVVIGPAHVKSLYFEPPSLVDELLDEVMAMPGALPLLSFALAEMYRQAQIRRRETGATDRALTLADYRACGGVVGALHRRANTLYEDSDAPTQATVRSLFLRMLSQDGARLSRRRIESRELEFEDSQEQSRVVQVLERYIGARLLVADENCIEPAHDTLIVAWEKLQTWLSESGSQDLQRAIWFAASEWHEHGSASTLLWHDDHRLSSVVHAMDSLNRIERQFVRASTRRKNRRRVTTIVATLSLIGVLAFASYYSLNQAHLANEQRNAALQGQSQFLADLSRQQTESGNAMNGLLLALEALPDSMDQPDRPYVTEAEAQLYNAVSNLHEMHTLAGHTDRVTFATFRPDGQRLVTASHDKSARLWDPNTGEVIAVLADHTARVAHAAFSADNNYLVTLSQSGTATLWRASDGQFIREMNGGDEETLAVYFHPDSRRIMTVGYATDTGGNGRLWDIESGAQLQFLASPDQRPYAVSQGTFSPDGRYAVTGDRGNNAVLWRLETGAQIALLAHSSGLYYTTFSPSSDRVLTASADFSARVWSSDNGSLQLTLTGHRDKVFHAEFSPDGKRIVTASADGTARIWDAESGAIRHTLRGHRGEVRHASFSPDGTQIVTSSRDDTARVWSSRDGRLQAILGGHLADVTHAHFSPDGQTIVSTGDQTARLWSSRGAGLYKEFSGHAYWPTRSAVSPDGKRLVTIGWIATSFNRQAHLWDTGTGQRITTLNLDRGESAFSSIMFCADGNTMVSKHGDHGLRLWDGVNGQPAGIWNNVESTEYVACSTQLQQLASGSLDDWRSGTPGQRWHIGSGDPVTGDLPVERRGLQSLWTLMPDDKRSPSGNISISYGYNQYDPILESTSGGQKVQLIGHPQRVTHVAISPDERLAATASVDHRVRLWERSTGRLLATLVGHSDMVNWIAFSPDGKRLVSGSGKQEYTFNDRNFKIAVSEDDSARVWDVQTRRQIAVLSGHEGRILHAYFTPDSQHVVTGSEDGTARIWTLFPSTSAMIRYARSKVSRQLTDAQRKAFFLDGR